MLEPVAQSINDFWFGNIENDIVSNEKKESWFKKDPKFDRLLEKKFADYLDVAFMGAFDRWTNEPEGLCALIVLLDQFPRNIFRGSYKSFHFDKKALATANIAIQKEAFLKVPTAMGYFMLMPTMHSESLETQELGIKSFEKLLDHAPEGSKAMIQNAIKYAHSHKDIIAKFGRFPHRNEILERESTPEELEFLKQPGSSF